MMIFFVVISFLGGIALLLYGIRLAGEGLQKAAGGRLRAILTSLTKNRYIGIGVGAAITAILQSSSAATVMLVGFVSSGLMTLNQTIGVILGADIGTTVTVQLLAFRVYDVAILFIAIGIGLMSFAKRAVTREIGQGILGFAFIFFSIKIMSDSMTPLRESEYLKSLLLSIGESPLLGILLAALMTALVQSSAAVIGMALALSLQNLMTLDVAIPIILGANIGTCAAAILTSIGANLEARQVAAAHILFKVIGVSLFYPLIGPFKDLIEYTASDIPRQIANAHTLFNVAIAVIFLPFANPFANLVRKIIPEREGEERFGPKYLDPHVLNTPSLALGQATREALRMSDIVQWMLKESIQVFKANDRDLLYRIEQRDDELDLLDREIKLYLTRIAQSTLTPSESKKEFELIAFTSNMENIGDIIDKNLMELAKKKITTGVSFSEEGLREIVEFHQKVLENFDISVSVFVSRNKDLAKKILRHKARLGEVERDFRQAHINRLHEGLQESVDTSAIHLDVLSNLKRINSHITNIAYPILEENGE
ncbi:MAG: Na/Pi cotransporter family protein [Nitrospirae bacterium]|nr:Na/Pi cotransporter family protein [Nitrospirota bacterium]